MMSLPLFAQNPWEGDNLVSIDFFSRLILLAEGAANAAAPADAPANASPGLAQMLPLVLMIMVVFYLMLVRPQQKEQKKRQDLLNNLKKNDRVVTIGGIYGVVMNAKRETDEVIIKVDETNDTKIRVIYNAIARVITDEPKDESKK
jgi:preprotein translocase subunit YajC